MKKKKSVNHKILIGLVIYCMIMTTLLAYAYVEYRAFKAETVQIVNQIVRVLTQGPTP